MPSLSDMIYTHIAKHWPSVACPLCRSNDWTMNGPFGLLPVTVGADGYVNGYRATPEGSPVVAMVCRTCGHTRLIDYNVVIGKEP